MKKIHFSTMLVPVLIFLILGNTVVHSYSQHQFDSKSTVHGKIFDKQTGEPLSNVNVFLASTTIGDASASNGFYQIKNIPPGVYTLVFSMIGYEIKTFQLQIRTTQMLEYNVKLIPRPIKGKEVTVTASVPKGWKEDLKRFTTLFLGESKNAKKCKILNPYVLDFSIDPDTKEFIATSDSILKIENRALGYQLEIVLDRFNYDYSAKRCVFGMYTKYMELQSRSDKEMKRWKKNRLSTYSGSFRHFLFQLVHDNLKKENFQIYSAFSLKATQSDDRTTRVPGAEYKKDEEFLTEKNIRPIKIPYSSTLTGLPVNIKEENIISADSSDAIKKLHFDHFLGVIYKGREPHSWLKLNYHFAEIDTFGNILTPYAITKYGEWANEMVADFLPFDYRPKD